MIKQISKCVAAAALVALAACGGGDEGPSYASEIDESNMGGAAETSYGLVGGVIDGLVTFNDGAEIPWLPLAPAAPGVSRVERLLMGIQATALRRAGRQGILAARPPQAVHAACVPVETGIDELGDWIDTDADGAPDDYKVTFPSGCSITEGEFTYTWSGAVRLRDVAGLFGFRVDFLNLKYRVTHDPSGDYETWNVNGMEQGVYATNGVDHTADIGYLFGFHSSGVATASGLQTSAAPSDFAIAIAWNENTSFDPDGTITTESVGSGDISIDLDFGAVLTGTGEPTQAFRFALTTPTVLHYDASSCFDINSGQLRGALNGSESIYFLITWTGCGTTSYQTFGTTDGGVTVARHY